MNGSDGYRAVEDVCPFVESGGYGTEALEGVDRSLDFVAAFVDRFVEAGGPAAGAAAALAVGPLVLALGNGVLDLPTPQTPAVPTGRVRFVAAQMIGARARMTAGRTRDTDALEDGDQLRGIAPPAWCDDDRERTSAALTGQMDLAGQPAAGTSQGLIRMMLNRSAASSRDTRRGGAGACGVLMGTAGGRVHADHAPVNAALRAGIGLDGPQNPIPCAVRRSSASEAPDGPIPRSTDHPAPRRLERSQRKPVTWTHRAGPWACRQKILPRRCGGRASCMRGTSSCRRARFASAVRLLPGERHHRP